MHNNILKIILKNILFIIIILVFFEITFFGIECFKYYQQVKDSAGFFSLSRIKYSFKVRDFGVDEPSLRPVVKKGNKHSIILFSDSYPYGTNLDENQTFSYKLAEATNSTVYNRSFPGWGAQQILYQLKTEDFYSRIKTSDYIIYTFIDDHLNRLNNYQWGGYWTNTVNLRLKEENGNLTEIKPLFKPFWFLFTVKELQCLSQSYLNSPSNYEKNFQLFSRIMKESLYLTKKHYPNSKFVILMYSPCNYMTPEKLNQFKELEKDGFIVIQTDEFVKENLRDGIYHFGNDGHPTAKAWSVIVPALVKKLNL